MNTDDIIIRLLLAGIAGGVIGAEREYNNKSAGFRTLILISLGSCLFTIASVLIEESSKDRIASNIVTGIGFVGAGVIFKSETGVKGLTTAATVWVTAAIGMAIGGGFYIASLAAAVLVMLVLFVLSYISRGLERANVNFHYRIRFTADQGGGLPVAGGVLLNAEYEAWMKERGMKFIRPAVSRDGAEIEYRYTIKANQRLQDELITKLSGDGRILSFESMDPD